MIIKPFLSALHHLNELARSINPFKATPLVSLSPPLRPTLELPQSILSNFPSASSGTTTPSGLHLLQKSIHGITNAFSNSVVHTTKSSAKHTANKLLLPTQTVFNKRFNALADSLQPPQALQTVVSNDWKLLLNQLRSQGYQGNLSRDVQNFQNHIMQQANQLLKEELSDAMGLPIRTNYQALALLDKQLKALFKAHKIIDTQSLLDLKSKSPSQYAKVEELIDSLHWTNEELTTELWRKLTKKMTRNPLQFKDWTVSYLGAGSQSNAWKFEYKNAEDQTTAFIVKLESFKFQHNSHLSTKTSLAYVPYTMNTLATEMVRTHNPNPKLAFNADYLAVSDSRQIGKGNFVISAFNPNVKQTNKAKIPENLTELQEALQNSGVTQHFPALRVDTEGENAFAMPNDKMHIIDLFMKQRPK